MSVHYLADIGSRGLRSWCGMVYRVDADTRERTFHDRCECRHRTAAGAERCARDLARAWANGSMQRSIDEATRSEAVL